MKGILPFLIPLCKNILVSNMQSNFVIIVLMSVGILAFSLVIAYGLLHIAFVFSYMRIRRFAAKKGRHLPGSCDVAHREQRVKLLRFLLYAPYSPCDRIRRFGERVRRCAPYFFLLSGSTYVLIALIMSMSFCAGLAKLLAESGGSQMLIFFLCGGILLCFLTAWVWVCMRFVIRVRRFLQIIKRCAKTSGKQAYCHRE